MPPSIVYVLPVPVCPYAKTVQLKPSRTSFTIGEMAWSYIERCCALGPNTFQLFQTRSKCVVTYYASKASWTCIIITKEEEYLVKGENSINLLVSYILRNSNFSFVFITCYHPWHVRPLLFITQRPE